MFKILFLYLFLFFISCSSKNHEITYHNNGKVKYNVSYKNNKLDGVAITYDEDGNIKKIQIYPNKSKAVNLAFDVTPAKYITGLITEKGICEASEKGLKNLFK